MAKRNLLIVTANTTAKVGMASYLSSIFHTHLHVEASRACDISQPLLASADCILYTTEAVRDMLHQKEAIPSHIHELVCTRTFNHTYLNKILQIPLGSFVYVVNDFESSTYGVIQLLREFGFSQYHFLPYYPGCGPVNPNVHYAITPGEISMVPPGIPHVINIGIRVPDISTIHAIIMHFCLPGSLADEITHNYINHIVQTLKLSHQQLSQAIDTQNLTQTILDNITNGICLTDRDFKILMSNPTFFQTLGIPLQAGTESGSLKELFQKYGFSFHLAAGETQHFLSLHRDPVRLWVQEVDNLSHSPMLLVHADLCGPEEINPPSLLPPGEGVSDDSFQNLSAVSPAMTRLLRTAKRLSLTDYPLLIQGGSTPERESLARSIHNNSRRKTAPFVIFSPASVNDSNIVSQLSGFFYENTSGERILESGLLAQANHGTLLVQGAEQMSFPVQEFFLRTLQKNCIIPCGGTREIPVNFRPIFSASEDLYEKVKSHAFSKELFFFICISTLVFPLLKERQEDVLSYMDFFQKKLFPHLVSQEDLFTPGLLSFLKQYSWPGNVMEIQNLFQFFSCVYDGAPLELGSLPPYLLRQAVHGKHLLTEQERMILLIIQQNPKAGRASIQKALAEQGTALTEGKIRKILQSLAGQDYIHINRTKGGCEITGLGCMLLR